MTVLEFCISIGKVWSEDVAYAETMTADLVCVSRADTLEGRTDLALAHCSLVCCIEESVGRKDEMCLLRDHDSLCYRNACLFGDVVAFALECDRVENHTVTHDVLSIFSEDS